MYIVAAAQLRGPGIGERISEQDAAKEVGRIAGWIGQLPPPRNELVLAAPVHLHLFGHARVRQIVRQT